MARQAHHTHVVAEVLAAKLHANNHNTKRVVAPRQTVRTQMEMSEVMGILTLSVEGAAVMKVFGQGHFVFSKR